MASNAEIQELKSLISQLASSTKILANHNREAMKAINTWQLEAQEKLGAIMARLEKLEKKDEDHTGKIERLQRDEDRGTKVVALDKNETERTKSRFAFYGTIAAIVSQLVNWLIHISSSGS